MTATAINLGDRLVDLLGLEYQPVAITFRDSVPSEGEFFDTHVAGDR